jgi:large subunit ribosomal protein L6
MSRVAKVPVAVPSGVEVKLSDKVIEVKGAKGTLKMNVNPVVKIVQDGNLLTVEARSTSKFSRAMSGTTRALVSNMVQGVTAGFSRKLQLVGVGYRVQVQGSNLNLTLGYSHPVVYQMPEGVKVEAPSQTEIVLSSADKQLLGQVAAEIRAHRPPEPYKGKGVRYADEQVRRKEAKKK